MLREANEDDLDEILEIYWENYEEMFGVPRDALKEIDRRIWGRNYPFLSRENLKKGLNSKYKILVYERDGKVLGFAMYYEDDEIFLDEIHVKKEFRGMGIGKALMDHLFVKKKKIIAYAHEKSLKFFLKLGFKIKKSFIGYLGAKWYGIEK